MSALAQVPAREAAARVAVECRDVWKIFGPAPEKALAALREQGLSKAEVMQRYGQPAIMGQLLAGVLLYGVLSAWYRAGMMNHFAAHTTFDGTRFRGRATAASLIWLTVSNTLLVLFTLGLLAPLAQARSARYFVQRLSIEGTAALAEIEQRAEDATRRGEGLAQAFDVDAF